MTENTSIQVLDKGFVELQEVMGDDNSIVAAARVSFLGDSKGEEADKKLLFYLMRNAHWSPFEMCVYKVRVKCPIFVARQWMRHRTWSYNEISRRYTSVNIEFYEPELWRAQSNDNKQASEGLINCIDNNYFTHRNKAHNEECVKLYNMMLEKGVAREQARMVLPQSLYTTFIAKTDLRNLLHFVSLRMDDHAQKEIRDYGKALYEFVKRCNPWTVEAFDKYVLRRTE